MIYLRTSACGPLLGRLYRGMMYLREGLIALRPFIICLFLSLLCFSLISSNYYLFKIIDDYLIFISRYRFCIRCQYLTSLRWERTQPFRNLYVFITPPFRNLYVFITPPFHNLYIFITPPFRNLYIFIAFSQLIAFPFSFLRLEVRQTLTYFSFTGLSFTL